MKQGLGDHLGAVAELNRGIAAADKEAQRIELRFLRGAAWGAGGGGAAAIVGRLAAGPASCLVC